MKTRNNSHPYINLFPFVVVERPSAVGISRVVRRVVGCVDDALRPLNLPSTGTRAVSEVEARGVDAGVSLA